MNNNPEIIHTKDLSKTFVVKQNIGLFKKAEKIEIHALNDINFSISKGEFVALLGPNGAGKSTLIKILIGVLSKTSGEIFVMGVDPLHKREEIISKIGVVFGQRSRLWYDLPVKESFEMTKRLYIDGYPNNVKKNFKEWEDYLINTVEINNLLDRQVKKLSLGEKMRCELVNTLLYNPELLFLDEPTIGLDVLSKQKIRDTLKLLNKQGKTILLTSHDTGDIEKLCNRVAIINHGKLEIDLDMDSFMNLNDESEIKLYLKRNLSENEITELNQEINKYKVLRNDLNNVEIKIICRKDQQKDLIKTLFEILPIADLSISSEGIEKILLDLYKKDEQIK